MSRRRLCPAHRCRGIALPARAAAAVVALLAVAARPAPAEAVVIDACSASQQLVISGPPSGAMTLTGSAAGAGAGLLGGDRDVVIERTSTNAGPVELDVGTAIPDTCTYASGSFTTGRAELSYDGQDGSPVLDPSGLGGVDLTAAGSQTGLRMFAASDRGATVVLTLYSNATACSAASVTVPADPTFTIISIDLPFSSFVTATGCAGPANPAIIGAVTVRIDGATPAVDLAIDLIETFGPPPPSATSTIAPPTGTPTSPAATPTKTPVPSHSASPTASPSPSLTPSATPTSTASPHPTFTVTPTGTTTPTPTVTLTPPPTVPPPTSTPTPIELIDESEDPGSPSPCNDGIDNDRDGLTDCADPQCASSNVCPTAAPAASGFGVALLVAALGFIAALTLRRT